MPAIEMTFAPEDATEAWPDLADKRKSGMVVPVDYLTCAVYQDAMESGAPSVCFRFDLEGGGCIVAQVTVRNMLQMQAAIEGRLAYLQIDAEGRTTAVTDESSN